MGVVSVSGVRWADLTVSARDLCDGVSAAGPMVQMAMCCAHDLLLLLMP
jgi:hypothetical protein